MTRLTAALQPDYVVLGGGNADKVGKLPHNVRLLGNDGNAFEGGFRLWRDRVKFKEDEPITMLTPE